MPNYPEYGVCIPCHKWFDYLADPPGHCKTCGQPLIAHIVAEKELEQEFYDLLLRVQHLEGDIPLIRQAANPTRQGAANVFQMREWIGQMRGIAAQYGIPLPEGTPMGGLGEEVTVIIGGVVYRAWQHGANMRIIEPIGVAAVSEATEGSVLPQEETPSTSTARGKASHA